MFINTKPFQFNVYPQFAIKLFFFVFGVKVFKVRVWPSVNSTGCGLFCFAFSKIRVSFGFDLCSYKVWRRGWDTDVFGCGDE